MVPDDLVTYALLLQEQLKAAESRISALLEERNERTMELDECREDLKEAKDELDELRRRMLTAMECVVRKFCSC